MAAQYNASSQGLHQLMEDMVRLHGADAVMASLRQVAPASDSASPLPAGGQDDPMTGCCPLPWSPCGAAQSISQDSGPHASGSSQESAGGAPSQSFSQESSGSSISDASTCGYFRGPLKAEQEEKFRNFDRSFFKLCTQAQEGVRHALILRAGWEENHFSDWASKMPCVLLHVINGGQGGYGTYLYDLLVCMNNVYKHCVDHVRGEDEKTWVPKYPEAVQFLRNYARDCNPDIPGTTLEHSVRMHFSFYLWQNARGMWGNNFFKVLSGINRRHTVYKMAEENAKIASARFPDKERLMLKVLGRSFSSSFPCRVLCPAARRSVSRK